MAPEAVPGGCPRRVRGVACGPAPAPPERRRRLGRLVAAGAALALGGCAEPPPELGLKDLGAQITVLGPERAFDPSRPGQGWYEADPPGWGRTGFSVAEKDGVLALRLETEGSGSLLGRRITAPLLAMPYLRWGWRLESARDGGRGRLLPDRPGSPGLPLYVLVAFYGGADPEAAAPEGLHDWFDHGRPPFDRALILGWSADPSAPPGLDDGEAPPRYLLHGGLEDAGRWVVETVDLAQIYARLWPGDRIGNSWVVFVAAGGGPTAHRSVGYVAEVVLSR